MAITCDKCGQSIPSEKVTLSGMVKCEQCGNIFNADERASDLTSHKKIRAGALTGMDMVATDDGLVITRQLYSPKAYELGTMALFFLGVIILVCSATGLGLLSKEPWVMFGFPMPIGVWLMYSSLCNLLNRTIIHLNSKWVRVGYKPLPWLGGKKVPSSRIFQVYCKRVKIRTRRRTYIRFEFRCVRPKGKDIKLIPGLESRSQARFIEREIEETLGLKDAYVEGEHWY